jgi:hypothetical protein
MKKKYSKEDIMNYYYSDDELRAMRHKTAAARMHWLTKAILTTKTLTPVKAKKLQAKLMPDW